ncbi:DUF3055 domain-containing protein [Alkalihalobacillus sp. CinArs1]|uniref:DUF3055 domain-containing protein n=1 Tax=Alkalihalobacillus sp. CinArs1 TaxID=2995314 RepID=UPI0022DDA48E|nr:DUF3055 domain-containing protein [Alkalihalobacillus sp. CinArs1]
MLEDDQFIYDEKESTESRFICFMGHNHRFDLCIVKSDRFYGKSLVLDIQGGKFAIVGQDDLDEPGYLEHAYTLNEEDAEELREFLRGALV